MKKAHQVLKERTGYITCTMGGRILYIMAFPGHRPYFTMRVNVVSGEAMLAIAEAGGELIKWTLGSLKFYG
ncbi:MAG: hypothetical protein R2764_10305 [Bacteroidales bacterium]